MNWPTEIVLIAGALLLVFTLLRVERKRLWVALVFLAAPTLFLMWQWASFYRRWPEVLLAFVIAGVIAGLWWLLVGRKLPAPTSDNIHVWGQESGPKPKPQEMQAEIQRLRADKERLETELRRLKGGKGNGHDEG